MFKRFFGHRKRYFDVIIGAILVLGIPLLIASLQQPNKAGAAWFNDSWTYRKAITFTHNAAVTNTKVKFDVDTTAAPANIQADCGDIRFTDASGKLLRYFLDTAGGVCDNASTDFYVLMPSILNGDNLLYMYYGNPSAINGTESQNFSEATTTPSGGAPAAASEEKAPSPVAYWRFDEGTGTTAQDSTTNNLDGTIGGSVPPTWKTEADCVSGKCLYFDGSVTGNNGKVTVSQSASTPTNITGDLSLSVWIKPTANYFDTSGAVIRNGQGADAVFVIFYDYTNKRAQFQWYDGVFKGVDGTVNSVPLNQWSHITITRSGTTLNIYVNGRLDATGTSTTPTPQASQLAIGQTNNDAVAQDYTGFIDEVKVYNFARSSGQILADYNSRSSAEGTGAVLGSQSQSFLSNGLVGYWKMDETSWTNNCSTDTVLDSSGNGHHGDSCPNTTGPTGGASGKFGNGGSFDGSNDYVDMGNPSSLQITSALTLSAWVKLNAAGVNHAIISKEGNASTNAGYRIMVTGSQLLSMSIGNSGGSGVTAGGNTPLIPGVWYHITGVYIPSTSITLYLNGAQDGQLTSGIPSTAFNSSATFELGAQNGGSAVLANAVIDEARVYNRAFPPSEIRQLYNFAPGPVGYWDMEETAGTTVTDKSGYDNHGTATDATVGNGDSNTPPKVVQGKYGRGRVFDGTDDYIDLGSGTSLNITGPVTVMTWVNVDATGVTDALFAKAENSATTNQYYLRTEGVAARFAISNGNSSFTAAQNRLKPGEWQHVAGTFDGTTLRVYINGILLDTTGFSGTQSTSANNARLGRLSGAGTAYYTGEMDEAKIYNYARTPEQIIEDMNGGHPAVGSPVGSAVAYWKFDEGYGTVAHSVGVPIPDTTSLGGTLSGPSWINDGKFAKALDFDGTDDVVTVANSKSIDFDLGIASASAFSVWINPDSDGEGDVGKVYGKHTTTYLRVSGQSGSTLNIDASLDLSGTDATVSVASAITTGVWSHILVIHEDDSDDEISVYVNGILRGTSTNGAGAPSADNNSLLIGGDTAANFDGKIDEFKIHTTALTAEEVKREYNRGGSLVLGSLSDTSGLTGGSVGSNSASAEYCVPGDTVTCSPPVGRWDFEEGFDTSAFDKSGNGNTGTLTSGPTWTTGKIGKALNFDGSDDHVTMGDVLDVGSSGLTIGGWVKTSDTDFQFISKGTTGDYSYNLSRVSTGSLQMTMFQADATVHCRAEQSSTGISNNNWHYIVGTWNTSSCYLYVDGTLVASDTTLDGTLNTNSAAALMVGLRADNNRPLLGTADDIRIYNYARTASQIAWDYNRGAPMAYYKFDECQGTSVYDSSGNGNTGTITINGSGSQTAVGTCATASTAWGNGSTGKYNSALNFDGNDDTASIPSNTTLNFSATGGYTVSTWVKPSSFPTGGNGTSFITKTNTGNGFWLGMSGTNGVPAVFFPGSSNCTSVNCLNSGLSLSTTRWNHVLFTFNNGTARLYVDGVQVGSTTAVSGASDNTSSSVLLSPGNVGCSGQASCAYPGLMDDTKIYNYALSVTQIKQLHNQGGIRFAPLTGAP